MATDAAAGAAVVAAPTTAPQQQPHPNPRKRKAAASAMELAMQQAEQPEAEPVVPACENAFELQRQQRIERNRRILAELGVDEAAAAVQQAINQSKRGRRSSSKPKAAPAEPQEPSRRSSRLAGQVAVSAEQANALVDAADAAAELKNPDHAALLTQEEYFEQQGQELADWESDGKFKGWVNPAVCEMYGIAGSASEAWEANGGGAYTRKPDMSTVPAHLKAKGWSEAKAFAATMLKKNPNTYFYRHVAPHETQAQGEWTPEEHELFLETARTWGVGDKWGLFSSHIPRRVGYQCSAYYRDVVVARGLIRDARFRMTRDGKAVFVAEGRARG